MQFYFAWVNEAEQFDPSLHTRLDEDIFHLVITEQEGMYPTALLTMAIKQKRTQKNFAFLSCEMNKEVIPLFKGRLVTMPVALKDETVTLEFIAEPSDADHKLQMLSHQLQQHPYFDPLFLAPDKSLEPSIRELLDARDDVLYWSRTTGNLELSNIFYGKDRVNLFDRFFYDSLSIKVVEAPLAQINMELKIIWRQKAGGETRLDHLIQAAVPDGMISTFTGTDLEARWWSEDDRLERTGYQIVESRLQKLALKQTGVFKLYPAKSKPLWVSPKKLGESPQQVRLKRNWYRPMLKVKWRYCQKRIEKVFFTLKNNVQNLGYHANRQRTLRIQLQDFGVQERMVEWLADHTHRRGEKIIHDGRLYQCLRTHLAGAYFQQDQANWQDLGIARPSVIPQSRGTFFTTDRGVQAVEHALEIARAHLAASTRAVEVSFSCEWQEAVKLTCDHSVTIMDTRLPGHQIEGKVKKIILTADGANGKCWANVTVACSVGTAHQERIPVKLQENYAIDYCHPDVMQTGGYQQTLSGLYYQSFADQLPDRGHVFPAFLGASDLLRGVEVVNDATAQEDYLLQHQYPVSHNLKQNLQQIRTSVKLWLEDLRSLDALEHHIHVQIPFAWAGPKHITLD